MFIETLTYLTFAFSSFEDPALQECIITPYVCEVLSPLLGVCNADGGQFNFESISIYSPSSGDYEVGIEVKNNSNMDIYCSENVVLVSVGKENKKLVLPRKIPAQHTIKTEIIFTYETTHGE